LVDFNAVTTVVVLSWLSYCNIIVWLILADSFLRWYLLIAKEWLDWGGKFIVVAAAYKFILFGCCLSDMWIEAWGFRPFELFCKKSSNEWSPSNLFIHNSFCRIYDLAWYHLTLIVYNSFDLEFIVWIIFSCRIFISKIVGIYDISPSCF
jgi:hypothetical protein